MLRQLGTLNPRHRFWRSVVDFGGLAPPATLKVYEDQSRSILSLNDSPDLDFRWSLNPYRGCVHGCAYCYARPSHEYLDFGAGSDFERKILVKPDAAKLLRQALSRRSWKGELILLSGNTDCYQPLEARYQLTQRCLDVLLEFDNPFHVITKSALVERDIGRLAAASCSTSISIPFFDPDVCRAIEPYAPSPARRLLTIKRLSDAGIDVCVNIAPVIPGLSDQDIPKLLSAARSAGATRAMMIILRLPGACGEVFEERLRSALPVRATAILNRIRQTRGGSTNDPRYFQRMCGHGPYAESIWQLFETSARRLGFELGGATGIPRASPQRRQLSLF